MYISDEAWTKYIDRLRRVNEKAAQEMFHYLTTHEWWKNKQEKKAALDVAAALSTKYGEASSELACEYYDFVMDEAMRNIDRMWSRSNNRRSTQPAEPAAPPTYGEVAKAFYGAAKNGNENMMAQTVGRLVKQAGADTILKNALRDGAQFAWVPHGDTCPFCIMLASRGWQFASKKTIKGGHAEHIHANCDCTFAVRFDDRTNIEGYDPDLYKRMYYDAGDTPRKRLNTMRRIHYDENKDYINAQKRAAYANRMMNKMSASLVQNDWSKTIPRHVSSSEKTKIIEYAKQRGVNIVDLSSFDGSKELIIEQIDTLAYMMEKYPAGAKKLTLTPTIFKEKGQFGGLAGSGKTIYIEAQALRDRAATVFNLAAEKNFAATEPRDIIIHEYGHVLARKYGRNGIVFAREAYYNIHNEKPSDEQLIMFLRKNISKQSTVIEERSNGRIVYAEMLPEILVAHEKKPSAFTKEFIKIALEGVK